ncbi:MAG TPA: class I SAM-dependent methyltransferase [Mycobacteriales bacterium]
MTPDGLAGTFDSVAELYERIRPGYPAELFDALGPPGRVLEIGAGTGQATRDLLARGWDVVALEPGPELARVGRREVGVDFVTATFEDWDGDGPFDLVFAATSWHWLDPAVAYPKAARLLRPGGTLAIVATEHVLPEPGGDLFFREVEQAYDAVGLGDGKGGPVPPDRVPAPDVPAIEASGLFEPPQVRRYVTEHRYTADEYLALLGTYSGHIAATEQQRAALFADIRARIAARGGTVRKHHLRMLQTARRASP